MKIEKPNYDFEVDGFLRDQAILGSSSPLSTISAVLEKETLLLKQWENNAGIEPRLRTVYEVFCDWCALNGRKPVTVFEFVERLRGLGFEVEQKGVLTNRKESETFDKRPPIVTLPSLKKMREQFGVAALFE